MTLIRESRALTGEGSLSDVKAFILEVLAEWHRISFPNFAKIAQPSPRAQKFADWLAPQDFLAAAYWLSSAYARLAGEVQLQHEMFFTPPHIAGRLIDDLLASGVDISAHRFIDPACGGAAFLAPLAVRMRDHLIAYGWNSKRIVSHICQHIAGLELDAFLAGLSNAFLRMALYEQLDHKREVPPFSVIVGDALELCQEHAGKFDVVICNPPYRKMKADEVARYRADYGELIEGQPNLYGLFFKVSLTLLRKGGVAGLLTPTSYLSGQYFSRLRTYLLANADTAQIDLFVGRRDALFLQVEQEATIAVLRKHETRPATPTTTQVYLVEPGQPEQLIGRCSLPNSGCAWPVPRSHGDAQLLRTSARACARLADYGYTPRIGPLVWNRDRRKTYPTPALAQAAGASALFPLVWASDVRADGHFELGRLTGTRSGDAYVDMGCADHPLVVRRPSVLLQRVTSSDQRRRLVAAPLDNAFLAAHGGFIGENHVVILEQVAPGLICPEELARVLGSEPVDRLFRCLSGATNVSVFELKQLPLPDVRALRAALDSEADLDRAVARAYQLSVDLPCAITEPAQEDERLQA